MLSNINKIYLIPIFLLPFLYITGPALPDITITFFVIICLLKIIFFQKIKTYDHWFYIAIIFYFGSVISSLLSFDYKFHSLSSSLPYIRFYLFCLFLNYFFLKNPFNYYTLINLIGISLFFVSIDICIQYTFGRDIFGFHSTPTRNAGPFGEELKGGAFISKLFIPTFTLFYFLSLKSNFYKIVSLLFFILCFTGIILSGERSALIIFIISNILFFIIIFFNYSKKYLFIILSLVIILITLISLFLNDKLKERYFVTTFNDIKNYESIINSHYGAHYLTAYNIFLDYPLFGIGQNNYRHKCSDIKYSNLNSLRINDRCSTHPHNYYIQIMSDLGIINFLFFILLIYFLFYKVLMKRNDTVKIIFYGKIISLLVIFWPFLPTGSFYNNWNSSVNWLIISISICNINSDYSDKLLEYLKNKKLLK